MKYQEKRGNMDEEMLKKQMKLVYELLGDDQLTEAISQMCWNLFTKLKEKGFTEDQAMSIVQSYGTNVGKK